MSRLEQMIQDVAEIREIVIRIHREVHRIMADQAALDQAVADLGTHVSAINDAAKAIMDKLANVPGAPDLSAEVQAIQSSSDALQATTDALNAAVAPAEAPPAEAPPEA